MSNCIENLREFVEWEYHEIRRELALKIGYEIAHGPFGTTLRHIESNQYIKIDTREQAYKYLRELLNNNSDLKEKLKR